MERLDRNLPFRWFLGLTMDAAVYSNNQRARTGQAAQSRRRGAGPMTGRRQTRSQPRRERAAKPNPRHP